MQSAEPIGDQLALMPLAIDSDYRDRFSAGGACVQGFIASLIILFNERVRSTEYECRRSEVLPEQNRLRTREVIFEVQNVRNIRTSPSIDRLIRITNHTDIGTLCFLLHPG